MSLDAEVASITLLVSCVDDLRSKTNLITVEATWARNTVIYIVILSSIRVSSDWARSWAESTSLTVVTGRALATSISAKLVLSSKGCL